MSDSYYQMPLALVFLWDVVRVTPHSEGQQSGPSPFPWIGIVAALAFRSVTQFGSSTFPEIGKFIAPQIMDTMLLLIFMMLAVLILRWVVSYTPSNSASTVDN